MPSPQFYSIMNYPTPGEYHHYRHLTESKQSHTPSVSDKDFSWTTKSKQMESYLNFIHEVLPVLESIPFVSQIYLCNSISFNALHPGSDIDLCIITKPGYLRFARFFSWLYLTTRGLKRKAGHGDHSYQFCLSFYLDGDHTNINHLRLPQGDIYLSYWVAHLVLLTSDGHYPDDHFFANNTQLLSYLPNHPAKQTIQLGFKPTPTQPTSKTIIEWIGMRRPGQWLQKFIGWIRSTINTYKIKKLPPHTQAHIIISPTMLKFHGDKRTIYQHQRNKRSKATKSNDN